MPRTSVPALKEHIPKKHTKSKLLWLLILLFAVLLAVLFFRSSLSKISEITFHGSTYATNAELLKQSGLHTGDSFFGTSADTIRKRLVSLPAVENVKVDKRFPGTIEVTVEEYPSVAYELSSSGELQAYLSNGKSVVVKKAISIEKPMLSGWKKDDIVLMKLCSALSKLPDELTSDFSEIAPSPSASFPDRIKIYTRSGFEVVTSVSLLPEKAEYLNGIVGTQEPGVITMLEADTYEPFQPSALEDEEGEKETTHD
ncbi:cell division protein DivIB [Paenibacillus sp. CAA11]|uniref:cell division protein FtsQ/DivIB n=1 Tax=Paenibacillus sp. CAA11 TaxID=1532905 RepID=UPI000D3D6D99|nr:FtsQ-type POTRA domain-containing protein [Paenibacillus sp. CAA11]AWB45362.1 cell division protein DivIB [Paenibacillus sp. CAA11]